MMRVGIIGLGVGERHIRCFESHPACEVTALCDPDDKRLAEVGLRYPGRELYSDPAVLLGSGAVDIVSIASPDNFHVSQALPAIQKGIHVFIEKPICLCREDRDRLEEVLGQNPQVEMSSNLVLRLSSRFQELRESIRSGEFGDIYYLEGDYQYGRLHKLLEGWRGEIPDYSVMLGGGVHIIDLLLWMTGEKVEEVMAYGNGISSRDTGFKHHDLAVALLKMKSGVVAKVSANFGSRRPHFHALEIHGTKKLFINGNPDASLYCSVEKGAEAEVVTTPYRDYQKTDLIYSFVQSILGEGPALVSATEVFEVTDVCLAINESLETGKPVRLAA